MLRRLHRTKIVATLGPATDYNNNLEKIIIAGADIVRMNFSHGTSEDHKLRASEIRRIEKKLGHHIAILGDLQGPKIRISSFREGKVFLKIGDNFILDANCSSEGNKEKVGINYKNLPTDVAPGDILLLNDGLIQLKVLKVHDMKIFTEVTVGGYLSSNKGINKLGGGLSLETLTDKDKEDISIAAQIGVDYLAISFPRCGKDLIYARQLAYNLGCHAKIIAKIERAEAVCSQEIIDDIILSSDIVMIARGDLGVEIGDSELIRIQKTLIRRARQLNRVVITATHMMESMITNSSPTRAEVMDVANAVLDGTDAVMLSAETAIGKYPSETVAAMARICYGAEKIQNINTLQDKLDIYNVDRTNIQEIIAISAMYVANNLKGISGIIITTESSQAALITSRINSNLPIFVMSKCEHTLKLITLYRGVIPVYFNNINQTSAANNAVNILFKKGYLSSKDLVIVIQDDEIGAIGSTNRARVISINNIPFFS